MPCYVLRMGGKWRVVHKVDGRPVAFEFAKNGSGTPADGGGHDSRVKAQEQARAINAKKGRS